MPIGVFDSGFGGLTVLGALRQKFPEQDFLYLGDTAHAPYGERSEQEVLDLTMAGCRYLFGRGCGLIVLACNTASAIALRPMQEYFVPADRRVLGVLVPMIEEIAARPWHGAEQVARPVEDVLFFATPGTVRSGAFARELALRATGPKVHSVACGGLVEALEQGRSEDAGRLVRGYVAEALAMAPAPDVAVLGCTHYPLMEAAFRSALPDDVRVLSQGTLVARALERYLRRFPQFAGGGGGLELVTSGDAATVCAGAERLFGVTLPFKAM
ncbi:glutamate racemase [Algicella marina]|uniref:Glutamate racemase n=1 Tax=Algicella marina TaxID=2683284 RepID=A0A6P1SZL3_9RHOB|nr:glutamate racemase [Algicella marina]QHQ34479.1 glutamate racemase [Algicella marina]